jgi:hypothetical protein
MEEMWSGRGWKMWHMCCAGLDGDAECLMMKRLAGRVMNTGRAYNERVAYKRRGIRDHGWARKGRCANARQHKRCISYMMQDFAGNNYDDQHHELR